MPTNLHLVPKFRDRASYLYVERAIVERDSNSIALFTEDGKTLVPVCDIALLMLGPGTKITYAAIAVLARNNCLVAWTGEEAVRLYAFGTGGTYSSERLLRQARMVCDPQARVATAKRLYAMRFPGRRITEETSMEQLRGMEGNRVRAAYQDLADKHGIQWEGRNYDRNKWTGGDAANRAISAANSCLYGVCHAAVLSMGFSPALGFIHTGKQLSFIYDLADLYKLEICVPVAFREAAAGEEAIDRRVRQGMRDLFRENRFMEKIAEDLMKIFGPDENDPEVYDSDASLPAPLADGSEGGVSYGDPDEVENPEANAP